MGTAVLQLLGIVCVAGAIGGLVNALISDNGFFLPYTQIVNGARIIRLGVLSNILLGAVAAGTTWGLYGPLSSMPLVTISIVPSEGYSLTLATVIGAVLAGVGGARVVTSEVDKRVLRAAVAEAINDPTAAATLLRASPQETLDLAKRQRSDK